MSKKGLWLWRDLVPRSNERKTSQQAKIFLGFVDKTLSEQHPFVDKVLTSKFLPVFCNLKVYRSSHIAKELPSQEGDYLYPRRGLHRYFNFFKVLSIILSHVGSGSSKSIVLFVRNEPIFLIACVIGKFILRCFGARVDLVFQSSFPHESYSGRLLQRIFTRFLFKLCFIAVDRFIAVSQLGLDRLSKYGNGVQTKGYAIPLLSEYPRGIGESGKRVGCPLVKLVYIGSLQDDRQFDLIYNAYMKAKKRVPEMSLTVFGTIPSHNIYPEVEFRGFVERKTMLKDLPNFDIGICLIPFEPKFHECSPTKLGDYIQEGIVPLCSGDIAGLKEVSNAIYSMIPTPIFCDDAISSALHTLANWPIAHADEARAAVSKFHYEKYNYEARRAFINEAIHGVNDLKKIDGKYASGQDS